MVALLPVIGLLALAVPSIAMPHASSSVPVIVATPTSSSSTPTASPSSGISLNFPILLGNIDTNAVKWVNDPRGGTCDDTKKQIILDELAVALEAAQTALDNYNADSSYFKALFPESIGQDSDFKNRFGQKLYYLTLMLQGKGGQGWGDKSGRLQILCAPTPDCKKEGVIATMIDPGWWLNFCDAFFTTKQPTKDLLNTCNSQVPDLDTAGRQRAMVIIHELTHTSFFGYPGEKTWDYAYGLEDTMRLATGTFDRSCAVGYPKAPKILCPNSQDATKEGVCDAKQTENNADSWKYLVTGHYFEKKCGHSIPFTPLQRRSVPGLSPRQQSCPHSSNPEIIDPGPLSNEINGYVRFGDSYASGLGAGTTSSDSCRVGSNNYGNLLVQYINRDGLNYQQLSCSGDTLSGLDSQISKWSNQDIASFGTLTIGGNDLGFNDMVSNCVITPFTWRWGSTTRTNCLDTQNKARVYMQDGSENGLRAKLKNAYVKIMQKSTVSNFQLFVTGYPTFFNADTETCDYSSFQLWWGGYNPSSDWPSYRTVFLTRALRAELNDLVAQLNGVILGAIQDANAALGGDVVHFVDVVGAFEGHRWCEGGTHEPDPSNGNTYFLLSNWPDVGGSNSNKKVRSLELEGRQDSSSLPDGTTCADNLGSDPDPAAVQACWLAQGITNDPDGPAAHMLGTASAPGNYSATTLAVSWFSPTWLVETFHPRSNGMYAYRDAIIGAMQANGFSV